MPGFPYIREKTQPTVDIKTKNMVIKNQVFRILESLYAQTVAINLEFNCDRFPLSRRLVQIKKSHFGKSET